MSDLSDFRRKVYEPEIKALQAQLANARNDAIEEAAKECESSVESYSQEAIDGSLYLLARTRTALRLALRIRALKKGPNHV